MAAVLFLALLTTAASELQVDREARWAQCGVKGYPVGQSQQKIVNGQDAGECIWRWQVSLNSDDQLFCGGTLISPEWVLTAAHCVLEEGLCVPSLKIAAGAYSKSMAKDEDSHLAQRRVSEIYVHPLYSQNVEMDYDFALLKLEKAMPINRCVGTACLPTKSHVAGSNCTITGWGTLESDGQQPEFLQQAPVELLNRTSCEANYTPKDYTITSSMMCATGHSAGGITDSCQGDSGGPLVCQEDGRYILHGVVSWGEGCAQANFPGVYSRVASSLPWIEDVLEGKMKRVNYESPYDVSNVDFNGQMFAVLSGDCLVDEDGCLSSPGFADGSTYNNGEKCSIAVNSEFSTPLKVESFSTESGYDKLIVDCRAYSGSTGPSGVTPVAGITWVTDGDTVDQGWKLCPAS